MCAPPLLAYKYSWLRKFSFVSGSGVENGVEPEVEPCTSGSDAGEAQESTTGLCEQEGACIYSGCAWLSKDLDGLCTPNMAHNRFTLVPEPGIWVSSQREQGTRAQSYQSAWQLWALTVSHACAFLPPQDECFG